MADDQGAKPEAPGATPEPEATPPATGEELGAAGKAALEKERQARREAEKRLAQLQEELRKHQEAQLSETERAQRRLAELERSLAERERVLQEHTIRSAAIEAAARLGFRDPGDAYRLIDRAELEFDEDGSPRNVTDLLGALAKSKPYLLREAGGYGSPDAGRGAGRAGPTIYTRDQLRDPKFFQENRDDIMRAAAEGRIRG
jgi:hypothetical protein